MPSEEHFGDLGKKQNLIYFIVWNIHQRAKACKNTFRIFQFHDPMSYPTLCEVTQLNASMNLIGDVGAKHVASMLAQSPKLPLARCLAKVTGVSDIWLCGGMFGWFLEHTRVDTVELIPVVALDDFVETCLATIILVHLVRKLGVFEVDWLGISSCSMFQRLMFGSWLVSKASWNLQL